MHDDNWVDISFESFNQCAGSCPACNLSLEERNAEQFHLSQIQEAVRILKQKNWTPHHRLFLTYGDYPLLKELPDVAQYLESEGVEYGFTGTFVLPEKHYDTFFEMQKNLKYSLLDIIVDPFRMLNFPSYIKNIQRVIAEIPAEKLHLTTLISRALLQKFSAQELIELMQKHFGNALIVPNALPTQFAITGKPGAKFDISEALSFLKQYYQLHPRGYQHLKNELYENYQSEGVFTDCLNMIYHLDNELNVYAVSNTIIGDYIYDRKNNHKPLGNLRTIQNWDDITHSLQANKLNILSATQVDLNTECEDCVFQQSCKFFGVGNLMRDYAEYSNKSDYCYGPKFFELAKMQ